MPKKPPAPRTVPLPGVAQEYDPAVPVESLLLHPENPRQGDVGAISESMRANGVYGAVVAQRSTRRVLAGNHRLLAARALGAPTLPVVWADVDDRTARRILLADNRVADLADYNTADLAQMLQGVMAEAGNLDGTGYEPADVDELLLELRGTYGSNPADEDDAIPSIPDRPVTCLGDRYRLGDHVLVCGDSADPAVVEQATMGRAVDLLVTSPPYNVGIKYDVHNDERAALGQYFAMLSRVVAAWAPAMGDGRYLAWNVGTYRNTVPFRHAALLEDAGLTFQRQIAWVKSGVAMPIWVHCRDAKRARKYSPNYKHELVYLFTNGREPQQGGAISLLDDENGQHDVWDWFHQTEASRDLPAQKGGGTLKPTLKRHPVKVHPAPFPVALPHALINYLTTAGELVADCFGGSGSTMIAAELLGRKAALVELSPAYCDVAVARWEKKTGMTAVRDPAPVTPAAPRPSSGTHARSRRTARQNPASKAAP